MDNNCAANGLYDLEFERGSEHPRTIEPLRELVRLYESWRNLEEAAK